MPLSSIPCFGQQTPLAFHLTISLLFPSALVTTVTTHCSVHSPRELLWQEWPPIFDAETLTSSYQAPESHLYHLFTTQSFW